MFNRLFFLSFFLFSFFLCATDAQAAAPANDNQANATVFVAPFGAVQGTTAEATREQNELPHVYPGTIYRTVWYKYTATETKPTYFHAINLSNGFDAAITVYENNANSSSSLVASNHRSENNTPLVEFTGTAGITYLIVVGVYNSANAAGGQFQLNFGQNNNPLGDNFYNARDLDFPSGSIVGTNFNATNQPGEPARISNNDKSVWFEITNPTDFDRSLSFDVFSNYYTALNSTVSVYTGATLESLTTVAQNDNVSGALKSRVTFPAKAGVTYMIAVDTKAGTPSSNFSMTWNTAQIGYNTDFGSRNAATGEVFYDDATDITVFRPSNGTWYSLDSATHAFNTFQFGASGDDPAPADYDGDGRTDHAVTRNRSGGKFWHISNSFDNSYKVVQWGLATDRVVPGDYDLDGRMDIAVFRPSNGVWYILRSTDGGATIKQFGLTGDIPVPGDFAGTGAGSDLAVFRPSNGTWYIANGNNYIAHQFGQSGDKPVAANFGGDRKTDIAVYRPSEGVWYYVISETNQYGSVRWGAAEDIPQVGDFDTNNYSGNIADFVVYRPGNGTWYIRKNDSLGNSEYVQFGSSDDIPASSLANVPQ